MTSIRTTGCTPPINDLLISFISLLSITLLLSQVNYIML